MPLPRKFLNEDEELLAELRPHWIFYIGPLALAVGVWAGVIALNIAVHHLPAWTSYPLLVIGAIPTLWLIGRLIRWRSYTLALTSTRILVRQGVLGRDTVQLRLQRITEINLAQMLWERILGTGRLVIDVQGEDDSVVLTDVRKPAVVQRVINSQINELVGGGEREPIPSELHPHGHPPVVHRPPTRRSDDTPPVRHRRRRPRRPRPNRRSRRSRRPRRSRPPRRPRRHRSPRRPSALLCRARPQARPRPLSHPGPRSRDVPGHLGRAGAPPAH